MREKRVGLVGALGGFALCGSSFAASEGIVSPCVRSDAVSGSGSGGLCFCSAAVGGMSVTCFMNVAMAR